MISFRGSRVFPNGWDWGESASTTPKIGLPLPYVPLLLDFLILCNFWLFCPKVSSITTSRTHMGSPGLPEIKLYFCQNNHKELTPAMSFVGLFHKNNYKRFDSHRIKNISFQPRKAFCKKDVLKNCAKLTRKHQSWRPFFNKAAVLQNVTLLKRDSDTGFSVLILRNI